MIRDAHDRPLRNLRLSVTDRCNLRCQYCMPEEEYVWLPRDDMLSFEEMGHLVDVFADLGADKVRLTGGEPLLRRDLERLVRLIAANPRITAAFCTADLIAAGLLAGLHKLGKRIPEDVSVMGFDNLSISTMVYPALTTVDQSIAQKGRLAGNLIAAILNKRATERNTIVPTTIVERDSVGRRK